jgi:hypothetical protein
MNNKRKMRKKKEKLWTSPCNMIGPLFTQKNKLIKDIKPYNTTQSSWFCFLDLILLSKNLSSSLYEDHLSRP